MAQNRVLKAISFLLTAAVLLAFEACNNLIVPTAAGDPSPTETDFTTPSPTSSVDPTPAEPDTIDNISLYGTTSCKISRNKLMLSWNDGELKKTLSVDSNTSLRGYYLSEQISVLMLYNSGAIKLLVSTDTGNTWEERSVPELVNYLGNYTEKMYIYFSTSQKGWFLAEYQTNLMQQGRNRIFLTIDGGLTWSEIGNPSDARPKLTSGMSFASDHIGFVSYPYFDSIDKGVPIIYRTINGGDTWELMDVELPDKFAECRLFPQSPAFFGDEGIYPIKVTEYEAGDGTIFLSTHDGGMTWEYDASLDRILEG